MKPGMGKPEGEAVAVEVRLPGAPWTCLNLGDLHSPTGGSGRDDS